MAGIGDTDLKEGDRVVYPNQGVCRVVGTTEMAIGGVKELFIKLSREEDHATVMVPKGRLDKVGVRRLADPAEIKTVFDYLASPVEGPELDWKVRARSHLERMSIGGLIGLAQVVKGLATLADLRPLPPKERELYDNARHLLVAELAAATQLPEVSAEDAVDLALYPPGVERKKPELKIVGDDLGLDDLGLAGDDLGLDEPAEEAAAPEAEGETAEADGEAAEEGEEEPAPKKPAKAEKKPKAEKPAKPAKEPKAAKPAAKAEKPALKAKAEKPAKPAPKKAEKPAAKPAAKAKAEKPKAPPAKPKKK